MSNGHDTTSTSTGTTTTGGTAGITTMQQALADHVAGAVESSRKQTTRQLIVALILMLAGAAVGVVSVELKDTAVAAGFGTALIGAGATLLPAGASASANAQLHSALTQLAILAAPPQGLSAPASQAAPQMAAPHTPQPQQVASVPQPVAPLNPSTSVAGQQTPTADSRLALPAAALGDDTEHVTDAQVVSVTDADAADAAALRGEQPD
ncbi:MAG TPA: hypothetical protein VN880_21885 [Solirubrobacteraceae bacterium]|nr:hypothetical protein [Solirubrobacteraceae bacterium]